MVAFVSEQLVASILKYIASKVRVTYGATETGALLSSEIAKPEDLIWLTAHEEGHFFIFDEQGVKCKANEEGELAIKIHPGDPDKYLGDFELSKKVFRQGYYYPGDLAIQRDDGRIRITGRVADVLNVGGWKISVGPIETQIQNFLQAANVCIFAIPSDNGKNIAVVAVESHKAPSPDQIDVIKQSFKAFDGVMVKTLEAFPRTDTAMRKINRRALRDRLLEA